MQASIAQHSPYCLCIISVIIAKSKQKTNNKLPFLLSRYNTNKVIHHIVKTEMKSRYTLPSFKVPTLTSQQVIQQSYLPHRINFFKYLQIFFIKGSLISWKVLLLTLKPCPPPTKKEHKKHSSFLFLFSGLFPFHCQIVPYVVTFIIAEKKK